MATTPEFSVGVIGTGRSGSRFVEAELRLGIPVTLFDTNSDVAGSVADRFAKVARDHGTTIAVASSMEEAVDRSQGIIVATPDHLHTPVLLEAARRGRAALSEKPFVTSVTDGETVREAVRQSGTKLAVNNLYRLHGPFAVVRNTIQRGDLGQLLAVHTEYVHNMATVKDVDPWRLSGITQDGIGQGFVDGAGSHAVDQAIWQVGNDDPVVEARGFASRRKTNDQYPRPEDYRINLIHDSGLISDVWLNAAVQRPKHGTVVEVDGTKGGCRADIKASTIDGYRIRPDAQGNPAARLLEFENVYSTPTVPKAAEIFNAYARGERATPDPLPEIDEAMRLVYVLDAVKQSIGSHGITVPVQYN